MGYEPSKKKHFCGFSRQELRNLIFQEHAVNNIQNMKNIIGADFEMNTITSDFGPSMSFKGLIFPKS